MGIISRQRHLLGYSYEVIIFISENFIGLNCLPGASKSISLISLVSTYN